MTYFFLPLLWNVVPCDLHQILPGQASVDEVSPPFGRQAQPAV